MADDAAAILEFAGVTIEDEAHEYDAGLKDVGFALQPGELALVMLERPRFRTPIADAAQGLIQPDVGRVRFNGRDWQRTLATRAAAQRFSIGRVFEGQSWISNLDIDENILLPSAHHTRRPLRELREEAEKLSRHFGLEELPTIRPARATGDELRRAACVRAFLGEPKLLILERPAQTIHAVNHGALSAAVAAAREHGAGVLWLTSLAEVFEDAELRPSRRLQMEGERMVGVVGE
jgi:phospholipid/cholesterol/gamma-HCH transport system ATP-binding protein